MTVCLECEIICARALPILFLSIQINIFERVGVYSSKRVAVFFSSPSFSIASTLNQIQSYRIKLHIQIDFFLLHCFIPFWLFHLQQQQKHADWSNFKSAERKKNINIAGKAATTIYCLRRFYIYRFVSLSLRCLFRMFHIALALTFFLTGLNCFAFNSCHSTSTPKDVPRTHTHTYTDIRTHFWVFFMSLLMDFAAVVHCITYYQLNGWPCSLDTWMHSDTFFLAFSIKITTTTTMKIEQKKKIGTTIVQQMRHEYVNWQHNVCCCATLSWTVRFGCAFVRQLARTFHMTNQSKLNDYS